MNRVELEDEIERIADDLYAAIKRAEKAEAKVTKLREALEFVRARVTRIDFLAGLDEPIREQTSMARDAIDTALKGEGE